MVAGMTRSASLSILTHNTNGNSNNRSSEDTDLADILLLKFF